MATPDDPTAFDQIARELHQPLLRYLQRYVGDPDTADDLLQESLVRIARGLPGFAGRSSLKTWAFSIATRVAADSLRSPERRRRIVELEEDTAADEERAVDEELVVDEMNRCVRRVIDGLPEDYRAALVLHDLEGLPAHEVADVCECSLANAKIRIHRARARLKRALDRECELYRDDENVVRCDRKP